MYHYKFGKGLTNSVTKKRLGEQEEHVKLKTERRGRRRFHIQIKLKPPVKEK